MDANALYYTLSTIAQTLAGGLAVMVAFVVFRLPVIEDVIGAGLAPLKAEERKVPYSESAPILKKQGWEALKKYLAERGDEHAGATDAPRISQAAHLAWRYRTRTVFWLKLSLGSSVLDIAVCFVALPLVPHIACSVIATRTILTLAVGLGIVSLGLFVRLILTVLGRTADS